MEHRPDQNYYIFYVLKNMIVKDFLLEPLLKIVVTE